MKVNLKLLCIFLIIYYIIFIIYIAKYNKIEKFTGIFELLNTSIENNKKYNYPITVNENENNNNETQQTKKITKKNIKFIYLLKINDSKYIFYNKNLKKYMSVIKDYKYHLNDILFKDLNNNVIGNLVSEKYNQIIIYLNFYNKNANFEYLRDFKEIKFYLENDDKYFFIKKDKDNNNYVINLFNLFIGKITYNEDKKLYKIMCYEEYKTYLNIFGISLILLSN
jgi:hypothetical protein